MSEHLDLDALAGVLDDEPAPSHLSRCPRCQAELEELRQASMRTTASLAALPARPMPADVAERLARALRDGAAPSGAAVTTLPPARDRRALRWLPAAAAVVLLLGGAAYGISRLGGTGGSSSTSASGDKAATAPEVAVVRNSSGTDYSDRASLATAVPGLLAGSATASRDALAAKPPGGAATTSTSAAPQAQLAADPLARLRDNAGLAECLLALLPPEDPSMRPLAIDYATYKGAPAMVVVLPSVLPNKLDVFVVGPGCSRANDSTLFYTSVDKP